MDNRTFVEQLKRRMLNFAVEAIGLAESLPRGFSGDVVGRQFLRAASSIGANYRAACLGKSKADFAAKLSIAQEEADECQYWLEILATRGMIDEKSFSRLHGEARELTAILTRSILTARANLGAEKKRPVPADKK